MNVSTALTSLTELKFSVHATTVSSLLAWKRPTSHNTVNGIRVHILENAGVLFGRGRVRGGSLCLDFTPLDVALAFLYRQIPKFSSPDPPLDAML